ncbi:MAG: hypothetical protein B7X04_01135 [Parcubacteria group bacterium 21-54-25]|nr:MAG: hypothetical protein B7X04_01135 [Parcubacteria group bacterium 21-54-25]HQU07837.1 hypothetical protein [Candidatus Paceibacterota bacterium]
MRRTILIGLILVIVIGVGMGISSKHLSDGVRTPISAATSTPPVVTLVSLTDTYRRGTHTISGAVTVPTPCYAPVAQTTLVPSTTPPEIRLDLSVPIDTGICLQLPATTTFSVAQSAARDAVIAAYVNGVFATSTGTTTSTH